MSYVIKPPFESRHLMSRSLPSEFIMVRVTTESMSRDLVMRDSVNLDPAKYLALSYDSAITDTPNDLAVALSLLNKISDVSAFFRTKEFGCFTIEKMDLSQHRSISAEVIYEKEGVQYQLRLTTNFIDRLTNPSGRTGVWIAD